MAQDFLFHKIFRLGQKEKNYTQLGLKLQPIFLEQGY